METFLYQVANRILAENPTGELRTLVVFNNRRSIKFLHREFARLSKQPDQKPLFVPECMIIDEVVQQLGGLRIVPNEFLLFELYSIHTELGGDQRKYSTFEEFFSFGELMMSDFAEIDQYRVDARQLFINLYDHKAIGEWDIEGKELTSFQRDYLEFYHSLYDYYRLLRERLAARGEAYSGMAYRTVAEHIDQWASKLDYDRIYFVGFNALTTCEQAIIDEYIARGVGRFVTDGDTYYYTDPKQEAGYFLRHLSTKYSEIGHYGPSLFGQGKKHITIADCASNVLQCKYAGQILKEHPDWLADPGSTAVVLADEGLMIPMLASLPGSIEGSRPYRVNISMGFAYADSSIHSLVLKLLRLYKNANPHGYYHRDLVEVLSDFFLTRLAEVPDLRRRTLHFLTKNDRIRCTAAEVDQLLTQVGGKARWLARLFPAEVPSVDDTLSLIDALTSLFVESNLLQNNKKEQQSVGGLTEIVDFLRGLQERYHYMQSADTLERVYSRVARHHSIAFLGEPLEDLQLLGMLETRNLDFKHIILLSANEGVLPAGRMGNTLIPYCLKREASIEMPSVVDSSITEETPPTLPTYREKDNIFAYHFYRLIQRANDVYLLYSSESEVMGKGEPSRFVRQVRSELVPTFASHISLDEVVIGASQRRKDPIPKAPSAKSQTVLNQLGSLAERGFSPTALNAYINCPLSYYYTYVMGLREKDEPDDDIDTSGLGTAVHNTLQQIYQPFVGQFIPLQALREARAHADTLLQAEFDKLFEHGRTAEGRNTFMLSVAKAQLQSMLSKEVATLEEGHSIEVVGLEQELGWGLNMLSPTGGPVRLKGTADRIDRYDGQLRIIDYKTGSVDTSDLRMPYPIPTDGKLPPKWMQLICYSFIYSRTHSSEPICSAIYPLRYTRRGPLAASWGGAEALTSDMLAGFEGLVVGILQSLFDADTPFAPSEKPFCNFCPARSFCSASVPSPTQ